MFNWKCFNTTHFTTFKKYGNSHLTYKGKSVIIDYLSKLNDYSENLPKNCVPVEICPFGNGTTVIYAELDEKWKKVDIGKLITLLDDILKDEPNG